MKINRSSKLSLKFATANKHQELAKVLDEYARVVNGFIALLKHKENTGDSLPKNEVF